MEALFQRKASSHASQRSGQSSVWNKPDAAKSVERVRKDKELEEAQKLAYEKFANELFEKIGLGGRLNYPIHRTYTNLPKSVTDSR